MSTRTSTRFPRNPDLFLRYSRAVQAAMTDNPHFKEISAEFLAALALLPVKINEMQAAYDAAKRRDTVMIAYRDRTQRSLAALMKDLARHVELVAQGDASILKSSGFNLVKVESKKVNYPLATAALALQRSRLSGTMIAKGKPLPGAWRYEFWLAKGDPSKEENWYFYCDSPHCSRIEITDRTPGENVTARMRGIWAAGPGPWSPTVTLMSL